MATGLRASAEATNDAALNLNRMEVDDILEALAHPVSNLGWTALQKQRGDFTIASPKRGAEGKQRLVVSTHRDKPSHDLVDILAIVNKLLFLVQSITWLTWRRSISSVRKVSTLRASWLHKRSMMYGYERRPTS